MGVFTVKGLQMILDLFTMALDENWRIADLMEAGRVTTVHMRSQQNFGTLLQAIARVL